MKAYRLLWIVVLAAATPVAAQNGIQRTFLLQDTSFSTNPETGAGTNDPNTIFGFNPATGLAEAVSQRLVIALAGTSALVDAITYGLDIGGENDHSYFEFSISRDANGNSGGAPFSPLFMEPIEEAESDMYAVQEVFYPFRLFQNHCKSMEENTSSPVITTFFLGGGQLGLHGIYGFPRGAPPDVSNVAAYDRYSAQQYANSNDIYFSIDRPVTIATVDYSPADIIRLDTGGNLSIYRAAETLALDPDDDDINALAMNIQGVMSTVGPLGWFSLSRDSVSVSPGNNLSAGDTFQFLIPSDHTGQHPSVLLRMTAEGLGLYSGLLFAADPDADVDGLAHLDPDNARGCDFSTGPGGDLDIDCEGANDGGFAVAVDGKSDGAFQRSESEPSVNATFGPGSYNIITLEGRRSAVPGPGGEYIARVAASEIVQVDSNVPPVADLAVGSGGPGVLEYTWTNLTSYDAIEVRLDQGGVTELDGTTTSFDVGGLAPGVHVFEVRGIDNGDPDVQSAPRFAVATVPPPDLDDFQPPANLTVTVDGLDATLSWELGATYTGGVEVLLDGAVVDTLASTATDFTFVDLDYGTYRASVRGVVGAAPTVEASAGIQIFPVPGEEVQSVIWTGASAPSGVTYYETENRVYVADSAAQTTFIYSAANLALAPTSITSPGGAGDTVTGIANDGTLFYWAVGDLLYVSNEMGTSVELRGPLYPDATSSAGDITYADGFIWAADVLNGRYTRHALPSGLFDGTVADHPQESGPVTAVSARSGGVFEITHGGPGAMAPTHISSSDGEEIPIASVRPSAAEVAGLAFASTGSKGFASHFVVDLGDGTPGTVAIRELLAVDPLPSPDIRDCHASVVNVFGGRILPQTLTGTLVDTVEVSSGGEVVADVDVKIGIDHPMVSELSVRLESPAGTVVTLYDHSNGFDTIGRHVDDLGGGGFNDIYGTSNPDGATELSVFDGESMDGTWTLMIDDDSFLDGTLEYFQLSICSEGALPVAGFLRGDASGDGFFNPLLEAIFMLAFGFQGGPTPPCLEAADADGNGIFNALTDTLYVLSFGFQGGPPPPAPFPLCGPDPDPGGSIGCATPSC